jgi:hypothetical protein
MIMGKPLYRAMQACLKNVFALSIISWRCDDKVLIARVCIPLLQAVLTEYMEASRTPTLVMLQSPWPSHRLTSHLTALNDLPIRMLHYADGACK